MSARTQRWFAWTGIAFLVVLFAGMLIADVVPPPSPHQTTHHLLHFYLSHLGRLRFGLQLAIFGSALFLPFTVAIFLQLRRIENAAAWAYLQLVAGAAGMFILMVPLILVEGFLYRIHQLSPSTLQTLSDFAWIFFISPAGLFITQAIACAGAILTDRSPSPAFPRWVGYFALWAAAASVVAFGVPFFKTGPLTWTGLLSYWLAVALFGGFVIVLSISMLRAPDDADPAVASGTPAGRSTPA